MADAEESPSSLADLEALAGLGNGSDKAADENAPEDPSFDLASLAASTATAPTPSDAVADDQTLDLSGLAASSLSASQAGPEPALDGAPAVVNASSPAAPTTRSSFGFVYGMVAGVAVAGALFLITRGDAPQQSSSTPVPEQPAAASAVEAPQPSTARTEATATPVVTPNADQGAIGSAADTAPVRDRAAIATKTRSSTTSTRAGESPRVPQANPDPGEVAEPRDPTMPASRTTATPVAAESTTSAGAMDSLLDDALGSGKPSKQSKARATDNLMGEELPNTPSAAEVTKAVQLLLPAIRGCAMGQSGVANTLLVVRGDGTVASAVITGAPYAGAASGRCMEGVLRRAKFGRFQQSTFRVQFPLSIRATP